ncbi:16S rRNA (uracil(1498)-N(3))-methyltransferase [Marivirga sp. S37H4]|uniref:Ribosomal RNA small subunit methyltransferase E n=1 Tax=Marivirga aurantiaca TaxID=2802615 RepID=A0A934WWA3_9BACT|nr:16S rRNA (uracil(1498)-N(3))-methyltransferase [Marivirga aurantiaca]MBK6264243.1 16S rRNA (uracil(1498)-N(3))-methyltransferase [Marivirga aurantiaca]
MILFYQPLLPEVQYLDLEESKHCIKVLRQQQGDIIELIDGKGNFYKSRITEAHHKKCQFEILEIRKEKKMPFHRHIAISPTKNLDRMEWFVEKAVEFGVDAISFLNCDHSERKVLKLERLEKKAISAMKQSMKASLPHLNSLLSFNEFVTQQEAALKCLAYVDFENPVHLKDKLSLQQNTLILIGPEGDFSEREVEKAKASGFEIVSLGESRLRTETAGIAAVHLMNLYQ